MKIYVGETKKIFIPSDDCKQYRINVCCEKVSIRPPCPSNLEGYIYNARTKRPVRNAKVVIENKFGYEVCYTDFRGHYKVYMPCKHTWCKIKIKRHKYYRYYTSKVYVKASRLDFKIYHRS